MTIRQATLTDIPALAALFDAYRVFYEKETDIPAAIDFLSERTRKAESVIFISLNEADTMTGFVQLYPLFSSTRMQRLWLLNDLYVAPAFRGSGISIALIESAKALCRQTGACGLSLETAKTNTIGNQLYPRTGFVADADHHYYYWDITGS
jgi:GNAT superfamily N-acetyltransferase